LTVLHPRHKLKYFERAGWEHGWIDTAEEIVRDVFKQSYSTLRAFGIHEDIPAPINEQAKVHFVQMLLILLVCN
jgi:hypothetical protein